MEKEEQKQSPLIYNKISKEEESSPWYYNWGVIVLSFFITGPLGLLLVWMRPRTKLRTKVIISVIILLMTFWMTYGAVDYYQTLADYYGHLETQINNS